MLALFYGAGISFILLGGQSKASDVDERFCPRFLFGRIDGIVSVVPVVGVMFAILLAVIPDKENRGD